MSGPLLTVIILSFNRCEETQECLESVYAQGYRPLEVVVVDNASTDSSAQMVREEFPDATLIVLQDNVGACEGRNLGLREAAGELIVQIDNDATIAPAGAFADMVERFQQENDLGIIFTRIEDPATGVAYRPGYGTSYIDDEFYTWRFHGCVAMIRRETIEHSGYYMPEEFFRAAEENDLAVRVLDAGYNILYMPSALAHHKLSPKTRDEGQIVYLTVRNNLAVAWKFYSLTRAVLLTLWRVPHYLFTRLLEGDLSAIARLPGIFAGITGAISRRRPVAHGTMAIIDALTVAPALSLEDMRAMRKDVPHVSLWKLARRRLKGLF